LWTTKVMQDAEWDHKPKLRKAFLSPTMNSRVWHVYGKTAYYYDVWSNVHYGYVGTAAGFSESVLLDGAGLEQIGTDILRARWPKGAAGVAGLRRFDGISDRLAISAGIALYRVAPRTLTAPQLRQTVLTTRGLTTKGVNGP
jgi:Bacterial toxin 44